ncbi:DUF2975 domain-containing protein [Paraclostridium bifermentans]|uniref:DUF2975 domain-containing protein n=1 Tax=Paraclostridium bifermentans TaxID=1490 RepID=UPI001FF5771D|nr:DUF2975 domain-containing protein [Paraclostridium bifermentans]UOW69688.1 DUF2975 domain-containing protein [Paraclostridium bifermentans]
MNKNFSSTILNNIVSIGIFITLILFLLIPLLFDYFLKNTLGLVGGNISLFVSTGIYICIIPYLIALITLKKLCRLIYNKNPFSRETTYLLKTISLCAFSEFFVFNIVQLSLCNLFDIYLYSINVIPTVLISFISLFIGLFSLVLCNINSKILKIKNIK